MAKKFMYVCIGIMALAVTFHIGAEYGRASVVDHSMTGIVAVAGVQGSNGGEIYVVLDDGQTYWRNVAHDWSTAWALPIPVSEVKFWNHSWCVSNDNEVWFGEAGVWTNFGTPPGLVSTEPTSWGKIKAEWGE